MNKNEFMNTYGPLVGAIDEGTSSARFLVFAANTAEVLTYHQVPISQSCPKEGWVEQDAKEILVAVQECLKQTVFNLQQLTIDPSDIVALGITNQRETTVVWDSQTGEPLYNAIGGDYAAWKRKIQAIYINFTPLGVILRWSREVAVKFDQEVLLRF